MYFALLSNLSISKWHSPLWGCDFSSSCTNVKIMMSGLFVFSSVESYLEMACSVAVLGGGSNKEYALHILHRVNGNIKVI